MKVIAVVMAVMSALVATGGALEFAYFGPGTTQFVAGLVATPAGTLGLAGGAVLWRWGVRARRFVAASAVVLLLATAAGTALDVMGPPAGLAGLLGGLPPLVWAWKQRRGAAKQYDQNRGEKY